MAHDATRMCDTMCARQERKAAIEAGPNAPDRVNESDESAKNRTM
jgi:hypothetical protein